MSPKEKEDTIHLMVTFDETKSEKKIKELHKKEEEGLASILSSKYGLQYIDLSRTPINTDALGLINEKTARDAEVAIFNKVGKKISVAVRSPNKPEYAAVIEKLKERGYTPTVFMVSSTSIKRALNRYKDLSLATETKAGLFDISSEEIKNTMEQLHDTADVKKQVEETMRLKKSYRISRILEIILAGGLSTEASDIHVEPEEQFIRLRYRLDGVLVDITEFDREIYKLLLARIKLLSGLKINVKNRSQDGRFSVRIDKDDVEIRTSVLPDAYGESIVMRILNPKTISLSMEDLGIEKKLFDVLQKEINKPNGMILTTGPTGSGKTTTLYSFLKKIQTPEKKIITIEDPIEYHVEGIVQTQVDGKNYTFGNGLRSTLRQDPDIIMVGEIRNEDVASTAINAALTGHLVFSTLHTNNAAGSFPRLIDLNINPKVISSAVSVTIAQRLLRKLCDECRKQTSLSDNEQDTVEYVLGTIADKENIPENTTVVWEAAGCEKCNQTGYKGRIGIFEAIIMNDKIGELVKKSVSETEIKEAAVEQGILTMLQDGILKVLKGVTSFEELKRVIDVEEK